MKGYKITENGCCLNLTYEVGKVYELLSELIICKFGFHFCTNPNDLWGWRNYKKGMTKIFEVEAIGLIISEDDKSVTNKLKVIREIPFEEYHSLFTNVKFDSQKNLIWKKDHQGDISEWKYDNQGNLIWRKDRYGDTYEYKYDSQGNRIWEKDHRGNIMEINIK
jgi:YD repeat-containing protein